VADDVVLNVGAGGDTLAADDIAGVKFQRVKLVIGANNTNDGDVASGNPLPISDAAGSLTVDGSVTVTQGTGSNLHTVIDSGTVSTITNVVHVDDNAGNLSIDDGGNSITVDGTVGVSGTVTVDSELTTADLDTGAGTDTRAVVGVVVAASGGAVALSGNSGNKDGGTVRVVLATDQPALTNKLLVTPDSVALPANQSVNVAQLAATTTDTNSGSKSAGTLRVVIATDQPALTNKLLVTPDAVTHDVGTITTAVVPGTGATNLGKAEDAAHNTGDVGVMALAVRASAPTERSAGPTDGDYEPLGVNEVGALWGTLTPSANGGLDHLHGLRVRRVEHPGRDLAGDQSLGRGALRLLRLQPRSGGHVRAFLQHRLSLGDGGDDQSRCSRSRFQQAARRTWRCRMGSRSAMRAGRARRRRRRAGIPRQPPASV
jgi:hypothetical protein